MQSHRLSIRGKKKPKSKFKPPARAHAPSMRKNGYLALEKRRWRSCRKCGASPPLLVSVDRLTISWLTVKDNQTRKWIWAEQERTCVTMYVWTRCVDMYAHEVRLAGYAIEGIRLHIHERTCTCISIKCHIQAYTCTYMDIHAHIYTCIHTYEHTHAYT